MRNPSAKNRWPKLRAAAALTCSAAALAFLSLAGCGDKLLGVAASIAVSPAALDFGEVTLPMSSTLTVSVSNQGSAALTVTNIKIASDPNHELSLSSALLANDCNGNPRSGSTQLSPGECATFTVTWAPLVRHNAEGSVTVESNDTQNPTVTLPVSGTVAVVVPPPQTTCEPACTGTDACCNLTCVDTQSDPTHCGGCNPCRTGQTCEAGVCKTPVITPPQSSCDDLTNPCGAPDKCCNHMCTDVTATGGICPCSGNGAVSDFGIGSIIIPMDVCWQRGVDVASTPSYCTSNRKTVGDDSPLKAYGLVFFLIRHQVTVYVAIDPNKTTIDAADMTLVSLDGTPPVLRYNWATGKAVSLQNTTQNEVEYRGGPFLIDASQHDRVLQLLANDPDFAQFRTAGNITVHIANEGFQSAVAKSIAAVPSSIALLSPDTDTYNILVRYLTSAGLNFNGAGGTPAAPGQIYDQLKEADFLPDFDHSNLKKGGYKLLWSPHWDGGSTNTPAQLATIGAYVDQGGDLFAECAAIGTLEGFTGGRGSFGSGYPGAASTRFQTNSGMAGNSLSTSGRTGVIGGPFTNGGLSSVFAQRGDFVFNGFFGAITDFHAGSSSTYYPDVVHYVQKPITGGTTDLFTSIDGHATGKGTVVYLAGHDYSYTYTGADAQNPGITAGSRMVLNTLFSLGANNVCSGP